MLGGVASFAGTGWTFGVVGVASLGLVAFAATTAAAPPDDPQPLSSLFAAFRDRRLLACFWLVALPGLLFGNLSVLVPLRLSHLGYSGAAIGAVFLCSAALEAGNNILVGRVSDRRGTRCRSSSGSRRPRSSRPSSRGPSSALLLAILVVLASLAFGAFFTPALTLLTNVSEARGLDYGYAFALVNLAWAPGETIGSAGGGATRARHRRRSSVPRALGDLHRVVRGARATNVPRVNKVLVANRGEIALRVFRAARELGLGTVAVVAPDDTGSLHARSADETVEIRSYLDSEEHIRAAKQTGADAIHPGYGFLAENGDFAEAVEAAGPDVDRPAAGCVARGRRQGRREAGRRRGRRADGPGGVRAAADREGGSRRRRPRDARRPFARRARRRARRRAARGEGGVRRRPRVPRALSRAASPRRDPAARRRARHRARARGARLLRAAAPPEGARGIAVARTRRRPARADERRSRALRARRSATARPAPRSSSSTAASSTSSS